MFVAHEGVFVINHLISMLLISFIDDALWLVQYHLNFFVLLDWLAHSEAKWGGSEENFPSSVMNDTQEVYKA